MIEELIERLPTVARVHGRIHQLAQVLDARVGFRRVFLFQWLNVSGAVDQKFEDLGRIRGRARRTETLDRLVGGETGALARPLVFRRIASRKIKTEVARIEISIAL